MLKKQELGRSMVETLGVLAVIGVISAGGLYGFNAAMEKYKANELINEANKRAVVVASQIAAGQTPNIGDFGDNKVGSATFASGIRTGETTFGMTVSGVDKSVYDQMKSILGSDAIMAITENCNVSTNTCTLTLRFNKDLKRGGINTNENLTATPGEATQLNTGYDYCESCSTNNSCSSGDSGKQKCMSYDGHYAVATCIDIAGTFEWTVIDETLYKDNRCTEEADCLPNGFIGDTKFVTSLGTCECTSSGWANCYLGE